jgi:outer membrane immunogenic protein
MNRIVVSVVFAAALGISPAVAQDWSGPYAGLSVGTASGDWEHVDGASGAVFNSGDYSSGRIASLLLGYNMQSGSMVYGAEFSLGRANGLCFEDYEDECTDKLLDLKGRFGYASGSALYYGVLGVSDTNYAYSDTENYSLTGLAYGLGVDFAVHESYFVGAELLRRSVSTDEFDGDGTNHDLSSVTARFGMKF